MTRVRSNPSLGAALLLIAAGAGATLVFQLPAQGHHPIHRAWLQANEAGMAAIETARGPVREFDFGPDEGGGEPDEGVICNPVMPHCDDADGDPADDVLVIGAPARPPDQRDPAGNMPSPL